MAEKGGETMNDEMTICEIREKIRRILRLLTRYEMELEDIAEELRKMSNQADFGDEGDIAIDALESIDFGYIRENLTTVSRMVK